MRVCEQEECVRWIHEICEETDDEPEDDPQLAKQGLLLDYLLCFYL